MEQEPSQTGLAAALRRSRWLVLAIAFAGLGTAGAASLLLPRTWVSTAVVEVKARRALPAEEFTAEIERARTQLGGPSSMTKLVAELGLDRGPGAPPATDVEAALAHRDRLAAELSARTSTEVEATGENACRLHVRLGASEPATARRALEGLLAGYRADLYDRPRARQEDVIATSKTGAGHAQERVDAAQRELAAFEQSNADFLGDIESQVAEMQRSIRKIEETDLLEARKAQTAAEEVLRTEEPTRKETVRRPDPARAAALEAQVADAQAVLKDLTETQKLDAADPAVETARATLAAVLRQRTELANSAVETVEVRENSLYTECTKRREEAAAAILVAERQLASFRKNERVLQDKMRKVPEVRAGRDRLAAAAEEARRSVAERAAEVEAGEKRLAELSETQRLEFKITVAPQQPDRPAGPPPVLLAFGGILAGAAAGAALARLLDARDHAFRDADAVADHVGVPTLGRIPAVETDIEVQVARSANLRKATAVVALGCLAAFVAGWAVLAPANTAPPAAQEGGVR